MTNYNKQTLGTFFQTGDVPSGTDYQNLIDSQVNIVETSVQAMAGPLSATELITPRISAANVNVTGTLTTGTFTPSSLSITNDVTAGGQVYCSATRSSFLIVSALGTTQATGAPLVSQISRLKGVVDGSTTGFIILANRIGWQQTVYNDAVSANLWPCIGGAINALSSNAAFAMATNTQYIITHIGASAYAVK